MSKKFKVLAVLAITALVLAMPVTAQISNTYSATAGVFTSDVDDSMNVHDYGNVEFEKWFGFVGGTSNYLTLGYATNFGGIYLGTMFSGNFYSQDWSTKRTTMTGFDNIWNKNTNMIQTREEYLDEAMGVSNNDFNVLIGVAGMGIRVGFYQYWASDKNDAPNWLNGTNAIVTTDYKDGRVDYEREVVDYLNRDTFLMPSIMWGMTIGPLTPYVGIGLGFSGNRYVSDVRETYTAYNGKRVGEDVNHSFTNAGYIAPNVLVGTGFDLNDNMTIGIEYALGLRIYSNDYDVAGFSGTADGTVVATGWNGSTYQSYTRKYEGWFYNTETRQATLNFTDTEFMSHRITPSFRYTNEAIENLKLGFTFELPIAISSMKQDRYTETRNTMKFTQTNNQVYTTASVETVTVTRGGNFYDHNGETDIERGLTETSTFWIGPTFAIGASYNLIPGRFTVNAGVGGRPVSYSSRVEKVSPTGVNEVTSVTETDTNGVVTGKNVTVNNNGVIADRLEVSSQWVGFSGGVNAGFAFNFTPNAALDLLASSNGFDVNATNVNVMFTFKF